MPASLENLFYSFQTSYFFQCLCGACEFCLHNMTCFSVTLLHLYIQCSFPFICYSWHGTINASQTTGKTSTSRSSMYASEQSERGAFFAFLHSKPANSFIIFCYYFRYFVGTIWHSTMKYWGGGGGNDNIYRPPHLNIGGGGVYPPSLTWSTPIMGKNYW